MLRNTNPSSPTRNRLPVRLYCQPTRARNGIDRAKNATRMTRPAGFSIPLATKSGKCCSVNSAAVTTAAQTVTTGTATAASGTANPIDYQLQVTYPDPVSAQPFSTTLTYIATTP